MLGLPATPPLFSGILSTKMQLPAEQHQAATSLKHFQSTLNAGQACSMFPALFSHSLKAPWVAASITVAPIHHAHLWLPASVTVTCF